MTLRLSLAAPATSGFCGSELHGLRQSPPDTLSHIVTDSSSRSRSSGPWSVQPWTGRVLNHSLVLWLYYGNVNLAVQSFEM